MTQEIPNFTRRNSQNPYQPLIEIIGILLRKIEITPKSKLRTGNPVEIHISETSFPQNASGAKELSQVLNTLKQGGSIGDIETNRYQWRLMSHILREGEPESDALFTVFYPNKELLIKERGKWLVKNDGTEQLTQKENNKKRGARHSIHLTFPEAVQWEKTTLKIKEGKRDIEIFYDDKYLLTADYTQLGFFVGEKQQKPDRQWGFLCALSVLSATNIQQATADKMRSMIAINPKVLLTTENVHKIKEKLVKRLGELFSTKDKPFYDTRDYYHPKFTILPEPILRRGEIWGQGGKLNENLPYEETSTDE